jgi:malate/lactate dehydrogenase
LRDVALSLPAIVGAQGAAHVLEPQMSADERERLGHSAEVQRQAEGAGLGRGGDHSWTTNSVTLLQL